MTPIKVEFNAFDPIGPNATKLASLIGCTARNYVSPIIKKWKEVPSEVREKVWDVVYDAVKALHDSNPELANNDLDHDSVASILGLDSRGHVKGLGCNTSKTRVQNTAPYICKIKKQQQTMQETMQKSINKLTQTVCNMEENFRNSQTTHSHIQTPSTDPNAGSTSQDHSTTASSTQQGGRCRLM